MRGTIGARCLCWHSCKTFGTEDQESFWLSGVYVFEKDKSLARITPRYLKHSTCSRGVSSRDKTPG